MKQRVEDLSLSKLIPSALTLMGLASGLTAIRLAIGHEWQLAVIAVICAMVFDMLDGRAARQFGADTRFGAQLDSLADLVSFGIAPALIAYNWTLSELGELGWVAAVIFCIAGALRLARFNIQAARDEGATESNPYFTGLPTPAAACLMLLPLVLSFQFAQPIFQMPYFSLALALVTAVLMVSRLPTPSIKYLHIQRRHRIFVALLVLVAIAALILRPWATLTVGMALYVLSIPVAAMLPARKTEKIRLHEQT